MKNFFILVWKRGLQILFIILIIWILYFILNFVFPNMFDFMRGSRGTASGDASASSTVIRRNTSLRDSIYSLFFASRVNKSAYTSTDGAIRDDREGMPEKSNYWDGTSATSYVWGGSEENSIRNTYQLRAKDLYIFPNQNDSIAKNFKINNVLIKKDFNNILADGNIISGDIATSYLGQYFFNIDIYDAKGEYIFSIGANAFQDLKDKNVLHFSAMYRQSQNMSGYRGDGYMVIRTDNTKVSAILILKIRVE